MVKVKVVDVMPIEQSDEEKPQPEESKEETKEETKDETKEELEHDEPLQIVTKPEETVTNIVTPIVDKKNTPQKKTAPTGKCDHCGKEMLMKTLKYSHMKLCMPSAPTPPPPPPPPTPVEKPKAKRAPPKPKPKPEAVASQETTFVPKPKPIFDGVVDFNGNNKPVLSQEQLFQQFRQDRLQQKQTRIKSLISQAF